MVLGSRQSQNSTKSHTLRNTLILTPRIFSSTMPPHENSTDLSSWSIQDYFDKIKSCGGSVSLNLFLANQIFIGFCGTFWILTRYPRCGSKVIITHIDASGYICLSEDVVVGHHMRLMVTSLVLFYQPCRPFLSVETASDGVHWCPVTLDVVPKWS